MLNAVGVHFGLFPDDMRISPDRTPVWARALTAMAIWSEPDVAVSLAMAALEAGVDVLVEKPLTETVEQGKRLVQKADEGGRILQVGHIERFNPAYIELKNVISTMKLIAVNIRRLSPFDTSNTDVDVVRDLMIHDLDLLLKIVGSNIKSSQAFGT